MTYDELIALVEASTPDDWIVTPGFYVPGVAGYCHERHMRVEPYTVEEVAYASAEAVKKGAYNYADRVHERLDNVDYVSVAVPFFWIRIATFKPNLDVTIGLAEGHEKRTQFPGAKKGSDYFEGFLRYRGSPIRKQPFIFHQEAERYLPVPKRRADRPAYVPKEDQRMAEVVYDVMFAHGRRKRLPNLLKNLGVDWG